MVAEFYRRPARLPDGSYEAGALLFRYDLPWVGGEHPEVVVYGGCYFTRVTPTRYQEATAAVFGPARPGPDAPGGGSARE